MKKNIFLKSIKDDHADGYTSGFGLIRSILGDLELPSQKNHTFITIWESWFSYEPPLLLYEDTFSHVILALCCISSNHCVEPLCRIITSKHCDTTTIRRHVLLTHVILHTFSCTTLQKINWQNLVSFFFVNPLGHTTTHIPNGFTKNKLTKFGKIFFVNPLGFLFRVDEPCSSEKPWCCNCHISRPYRPIWLKFGVLKIDTICHLIHIVFVRIDMSSFEKLYVS